MSRNLPTLRLRLWVPLLFLGFFFVSLIQSAIAGRNQMERSLELQSQEQVRQMLANTAHRVEALLRIQHYDLVADEVADFGVDPHVNGVVLLDDAGRVMEATRREWGGRFAKDVLPRFDPAKFDAVQKNGRSIVLLAPDRSYVYGYQPVVLVAVRKGLRPDRIGALVIDYDLAATKAAIWDALLREQLPVWSGTFLLVLGLIWLFSVFLLRPLRHMTEIVRRFGAGERDVEVNISGKGELALLGSAWNRMRKQLETTLYQLEESRENLEVTLFSIGDAVIATDIAGRVTRMNGVAQKLTGWQLAEATGRPLDEVFNIVNAHTRQRADNPVRRVLSTGQIVGLANHTVLIARDGTESQIADSAAPIRHEDGRVAGVVLVFRDVTDEYALRNALENSERQLSTIIEAEPECVKLLASDGALLQMNRAGLSMIEADSLEQVQGLPVEGLVLPGYRHAFNKLVRHVFDGQSGSLEFEIDGLKGGRRWLDTHAVPLRDAAGNVASLLAVTRDITERKRSERELRIAATAFDAQEGIMVTDANNVILRVNKAFTRLNGYTAEEAVGQTPALLRSGRHDESFYEAMWQSLNSTHYWQGEIWNKRKNGEIFPEWLTITAVLGDAGEVVNYVASFSDISQYKAAEEQIHKLAFFDSLTGLPNRRLLYDRLKQAISAISRTRCYGAILFIDLDHFKVINDARGHDIGDLLLIEVARRLQSCVRGQDTVARLGGDEFVVMVDSLSDSLEQTLLQVDAVGEKVLQVFAAPFMLEGTEYYVTPSIGISLFNDPETTVDELLKRADAAMYQAKQSGRNAIRFFDPAMQAALEARIALEADLRHALLERQFELYFQPQVDQAKRIIGAEVLLRWHHPVRGMVSPAQFIPLAEDTGQIVPIGNWVLETACMQIKQWESNALTRSLQLAVNVSARQFRQDGFVEQVHWALLRTEIDPSRLKLELTESLVIENINDAIAKMQALKAIGVRFSMDDFGTGHSSLASLKKLPLDQLKIDQSFVRDIVSDPDDAVIAQTIVAMAQNLGLEVIAEGVETEAQLEFLARCGCPAYQGYLFGRPVPVREFERAILRV